MKAGKNKTDTTFPPPPIPDSRDLETLRAAVPMCRACPLWARATHAVFGEGRRSARVMLVGEQPGSAEDRSGKPFVGPAGKMLDRALASAEIDRGKLFVTNAVKHFKWEQKGKLHMHSKPNSMEVAACRPWLEAEMRAIKPRLIVCLGATGAASVFGKPMKILENRGRIMNANGVDALITIHPSMLLRMPSEDRAEAFEQFVRELKLIEPFLQD